MAVTGISDFVALLGRSQLLSKQDLAAVRSQVTQHSDACSVARRLVEIGRLTRWQAQQLLAGRSRFFLGKYKLLDKLGEGGMGAVFKAEQNPLKRIVAIKIVAREVMKKPDAAARFRREIETAGALAHPNIIRALDADSVGNTHFLVMEYAAGEDLNRLLKRYGRLPVDWSCECIRQAAVGLQHAHERGLVHRDIKPGNLLIVPRPEGWPQVKILDLGLARLTSEVQTAELTSTGQVLGTIDYIAPEQAKNTKTADIRADIFSLGCTLYKMLTGQPPFPGENAVEKLMARATTEAPPASRLRHDLPPQIDRILASMLAHDPQERFQTPAEVAHALDAVVHQDAAGEDTGAIAPSQKTLDSAVEAEADTSLNEFLESLAEGAAEESTPQTAAFDPYHKWLGISPDEQPPDHYRLLGVNRFERDADVIQEAADQRMGHVRTHQNGKYGDLSQKLLNEIAAARVVLLNSQKRAAYDRQLRAQLAPAATGAPPLVQVADEESISDRMAGGHPSSFPIWIAGGSVATLLVVILGLLALLAGSSDDQQAENGLNDQTAFVQPSDLSAADDPPGKTNQTSVPPKKGATRPPFSKSKGPVQSPRKGPPQRFPEPPLKQPPQQKTPPETSTEDPEPKPPAPEVDEPVRDPVRVSEPVVVKEARMLTGHDEAVQCVDFAPSGQFLISAGRDGKARLWSADSARLVRTFEGHSDWVVDAAFSADGTRLLTASWDNSVRLWDVGNGRQLKVFPQLDEPAISVAFSPDGSLALAGDWGGTLHIWNLQTGQELRRIEDHVGAVSGVAPLPSGALAVTGDWGSHLHVWNLIKGEKVRTLSGHTDRVMAVTLSPDARYVLSGSYDHTARLWNVREGKQVLQLKGHAAAVLSVAFSPDGRYGLTASRDQTVRIWELSSGQEVARLLGHEGPVWSAAFSPDGRSVVSGSQDKSVRIWSVPAIAPST